MTGARGQVMQGFTLVEMAVVIVLLSLLAIMAVPREVAESDAALADGTVGRLEMLSQAAVAHFSDETVSGRYRRWPGADALNCPAATACPATGVTPACPTITAGYADDWSDVSDYLPSWALDSSGEVENPWGGAFEFRFEAGDCRLDPGTPPDCTDDTVCPNDVVFVIQTDVEDEARANAIAAEWPGFSEVAADSGGDNDVVRIGVVVPGQESANWLALGRDGMRAMEGTLNLNANRLRLGGDLTNNDIDSSNPGLSFDEIWLKGSGQVQLEDGSSSVRFISDSGNTRIELTTGAGRTVIEEDSIVLSGGAAGSNMIIDGHRMTSTEGGTSTRLGGDQIIVNDGSGDLTSIDGAAITTNRVDADRFVYSP